MENELLQKLVDKSLTKEELLRKLKQDYKLVPKVLNGMGTLDFSISQSYFCILG